MRILTWGYRGRTHFDIERIIESVSGEVTVIDVRRRASGGRIARGWSLKEIVTEVQPRRPGRAPFYYRHFASLGNYGRSPGEWTRGPYAAGALLDIIADYRGQTIILICAEQNAAECHRSQVAETLAEILRAAGDECEIVHLPLESPCTEPS